ncbi:unnamed protein product [Cunninghamella blakesleeana]
MILQRKPSHLFLSFFMALVVATVSGPQYIYPTYGTSLATKFGWTALENSFVSTACFLGVSFSGPLCSYMIERFGFQLTLRISAFFGFLGSFLLAQTYVGRLPPYFELCAFYLILTGFSAAAAYLVALDSQSHNFRHHRGMAMGFTSATLGFCGLIFSQINDYFFKKKNVNTHGSLNVMLDNGIEEDDDENTYEFLMFLAIVTSIGMFLPSFILGPIPYTDHTHEGKKNNNDEEVIIYSHENLDSYIDDDACSSNPTLVDDEDDDEINAPLLANNIIQKPTNYATYDDAHPTVEEEEPNQPISGLALLTHPIGFTMFIALFVVLGVGYVYLASIGQILMSLPSVLGSNPQHIRNTHVSIFSISNCLSRAGFGTLSDTLKNKFGIHRLFVFYFGVCGLILSQIYLITFVHDNVSLIPCTVSMAIVYGIAFGISPAATAEFGTDVFARNWGILLFAPALGSQMFNVLFGYLYDLEAEKQGDHLCKGPICFTNTYLIGIVAGLLCLALMTRTIIKLRLYRRQ